MNMDRIAYPRIYHIAAVAFLAAVACFFLNPFLAALPLAAFLFACLLAPFVPRWQLFLPVITRGDRRSKNVALTFDDGPDPATTPLLLDLMAAHDIRATFFVIGDKAERHPDLIAHILEHGHTLGNHTMHHDSFLMLRTTATLRRGIGQCQEVLTRHGVQTLVFRPPVGIVNPRLAPELKRHNLDCILFNRRGNDFGNRRIDQLSAAIIKGLKAGDIIMLHDRPPSRGEPVSRLMHHVEVVIAGVRTAGLGVVPLERLIGKPVMVNTTKVVEKSTD
jgi:peptidoglycan/xylan/chitin deacetylase (PgdA/CDA1 family)